MDFLSDVGALAGSAAGGGVFGFLGSIANRAAGYFETRQRLAHERASWDHEMALQDLQMRARAEETEQEIDLTNVQGSWAGFRQSIESAATPSGSPVLDMVRGIVRPLLTLLLVGLSFAIFVYVMRDEGMGDRSVMIRFFIVEILFLTSMAVAWWFGDRGRPRSAGIPGLGGG